MNVRSFYQGLHTAAQSGCGPDCALMGATAAPLRGSWFSALWPKLDFRLRSLCWI